MKTEKKILVLAATLLLSACSNSSSSVVSPKESSSSTQTSSSSIEESTSISSSEVSSSSKESSSSSESSREPTEVPYQFLNPSFGEMENMPTLKSFTPTLFNGSSVTSSKEALGEGADRVVYSLTLNNGHNVKANVIEVDTTKAAIKTAYNGGTIDTINNFMTKYETENPGVKVMAGVNGDYFPTGSGGETVNAYVNNKRIIKAGHNDRNLYDYTNLEADIPASMPMLLGVSGSHSRIGAMIEGASVEKTIKSKLTYSIYTGKAYKDATKLEGNIAFNQETMGTSDYVMINDGSKYTTEVGQQRIKIELIIDKESCFVYGKVTAVKAITTAGRLSTSSDFEKGIIYLMAAPGKELSLKSGDYVGYCVDNEDHRWTGYTDIIGGRHSLVENGDIAPTVTLENANGAQRQDTPRTAAGLRPDGTVCIAAIEGLRYGGVSSSDSDSYGFNLPELAEFMRYIGCYDALNFDGGGSTQLITANNNGTGERTVQVRSSDYGTAGLNDSRKVINTIFVTTK